jgi:hypothetical protein
LKTLKKPVLLLLSLEIVLLITGFLLVRYVNIGLGLTDIIAVSAGFTLITLLALIIFFRGQDKDPPGQTLHSLISISIKFLIELLFAFAWFFIAKKTGLSSVLLFFVLYLTFTLFLVMILLKTLKNKSL